MASREGGGGPGPAPTQGIGVHGRQQLPGAAIVQLDPEPRAVFSGNVGFGTHRASGVPMRPHVMKNRALQEKTLARVVARLAAIKVSERHFQRVDKVRVREAPCDIRLG